MAQVSGEFRHAYDLLEQDYADCRNEIEAIVENGPEREEVLNELVTKYEPIKQMRMQELGELTATFSEPEKALHLNWVRQTGLWKNIHEAPFCWRIINKPEGYPGDYKLMEMIYEQRQEGQTDWGKFIHKQVVDTQVCQAVRNRKEFLRDQKLQLEVRGGNILSLAAGPAREIEEVLCRKTSNGTPRFLALDHDIKSVRYVTNRLTDQRFNYGIANAFSMIKKNYRVAYPRKYALSRCNPKTDFKGFRKFLAPLRYEIDDLANQRFDLIYSAGLYDYLRYEGAKKLTKNLFDLLNPAGTLIVGNFSPANPPDLRFPMEYLCDWVLIYRHESEMYRLADSIPESEMAQITLLQEPLGINYFLKIVKCG